MLLRRSNRPVRRLENPGWLQLFADPPAPVTPNPGGPEGEPVKTKVPIGKTGDPPPPKPATEPEPVAVFKTHDELNARLDRAGRSALEKAAKEAGFESAEAMAAAAKKAKEAEEAAKTEAQRQADALAAAQKAAQEAEAAKAEALSKADRRVVKAEITSLARTMGAVDVDMVQLALDAVKAEIKVDEDGNVAGAQEALDALKTSKPFLFGTPKAAPPPIGGPLNPPKSPPTNMVEASPEEFATEMKRFGLRPHSGTVIQNPTRKG